MIQIPSPPKTNDGLLNDFLRWVYNVLSSGFIYKQTRTATSYTIKANDFYVGVTSTAAARTITLPALASIPEETVYIVKDESGGASVNNITIDGNASETIDGAATKVINTNYGAVRLMRSSSAWFTW